MARKLAVEIVGDSRSLERAFKRSGAAATGFNRQMTGATKVGAAFGVGFGGAALVRRINEATQAASSLNEEISKSSVVFGDSAGDVQRWAKTTATGFGISERAALQAASGLGQMLETAGSTEDEAAKMARRLVELGGDLASFNNITTDEALEKLRSGLAGEAEPLRVLGVQLSEARVQQEAYRTGIAEFGAKLTEQQKVLARYSIILKDTRKAQGDAARTSGSLANKQRQLQARAEELNAAIGQKLVPVIGDLVEISLGAIDASDKLGDAWGRLADKIPGAGILGKMSIFDIVGRLADDVRKLRGETDKTTQSWQQFTQGFAFATPLIPKTTAAARRRTPRIFEPGFKPGGAPPVPLPPTAEQRNTWWDAMIGRRQNRVQDIATLRGQLAELGRIAAAFRERIAGTRDLTRRLNLEDRLLDVLRQQRSVQAQIGDEIRAANQALKDRADAIKAAVIDRLQRRQTDVLNKRALTEALEQLRIARRIGGPRGIRSAQQNLADVRFQMLMSRVEGSTASLTAGGRLAFAGVVINIHGVTDPDAVARRVAEILRRRSRHTTTQTRGPAAAYAN